VVVMYVVAKNFQQHHEYFYLILSIHVAIDVILVFQLVYEHDNHDKMLELLKQLLLQSIKVI